MVNDENQGYPSTKIEDLDDIHLSEDSEIIAYDSKSEIERIHQALSEALEEIAEREPEARGYTLLTEKERTLLLEFFTVATATIERDSTSLLTHELTQEELNHTKSAHDFFKDNFNQQQREGLLYYAGFVDSGLKGELAKVRKRRNELVHEQLARRYLEDVDEIMADVDRALRVIEKLEKQLDEVMEVI